MNDLIRRLTDRDQTIEVVVRAEQNIEGLRRAVDRGYVHVRFIETKGGTELGVRLNHELSDLNGGNFEEGTGTIKLCGSLTLDYENVRCIALVDLSTLKGTGRLELIPTETPRE